jgi:hypothetical protein
MPACKYCSAYRNYQDESFEQYDSETLRSTSNYSENCLEEDVKVYNLTRSKSKKKSREIHQKPKKHFTLKEAKAIGETLDIDWNKFDIEQFRAGLDVELEHGTRDSHTNVTNDDPIMTGKIALAHLNELPDYYTRLAKMEGSH